MESSQRQIRERAQNKTPSGQVLINLFRHQYLVGSAVSMLAGPGVANLVAIYGI